jgi:hypothetical protein
MEKIKSFSSSTVGTVVIGALIGSGIGGMIAAGKLISKKKKKTSPPKTSPRKTDPPNNQPLFFEPPTEPALPKVEVGSPSSKVEVSSPPKPKYAATPLGQAKKIVDDTKYFKDDSELVEMFVEDLGPYILHNPGAFREAVQKADYLMDLQWLVSQSDKKVKYSYREKAVFYSTQVSEALAQLLQDTCKDLHCTIIEMKDLEDSIKDIKEKMTDFCHNIALDVSYRLDEQNRALQ